MSDATTEILLESAYFERMGIARSSKRLKLRCESSARFERGIDPDAVARNAERAMELLVDVAGAQVAADACDVYPAPVDADRASACAPSRVNAVLGTDLDAEDVWDSLAPLGIELDADPADGADGDAMVALVPTFRPDLDREIDLVEEVARRVGFDRIGRTLPDTHGQVGMLTARQQERRLVADALVGVGLSEAITLSLVAPADLERAGAPLDRVVRATNPLRAEESVLRTAVLPGLLRAVAGNRAQGLGDVALFEMGRVFLTPLGPAPADAPLPDEPEHVALALAGTVVRRPVEDDRPVDVYDAVDAVTAVVDALGIHDVDVGARERCPAIAPGGRPGSWSTATRPAPSGRSRRRCSPRSGSRRRWSTAELVLDTLLDAARRDRTFRAPSRYPASTVDLAFVFDERVAAADVVRTVRAAVGDVLEDVRAVRRVPFATRSAPGSGASRSRCASGRRTARSPTPTSARSASAPSTR